MKESGGQIPGESVRANKLTQRGVVPTEATSVSHNQARRVHDLLVPADVSSPSDIAKPISAALTSSAGAFEGTKAAVGDSPVPQRDRVDTSTEGRQANGGEPKGAGDIPEPPRPPREVKEGSDDEPVLNMGEAERERTLTQLERFAIGGEPYDIDYLVVGGNHDTNYIERGYERSIPPEALAAQGIDYAVKVLTVNASPQSLYTVSIAASGTVSREPDFPNSEAETVTGQEEKEAKFTQETIASGIRPLIHVDADSSVTVSYPRSIQRKPGTDEFYTGTVVAVSDAPLLTLGEVRAITRAIGATDTTQGQAVLEEQQSEPAGISGDKPPIPPDRPTLGMERPDDESGEVARVNARLEELVTISKTGSENDRAEAAEEIESILKEAIYTFPGEVTGIRVQISSELDPQANELMHGDGEREQFDALRRAYEAEHGEPFPNTVTVPLPYEFSTGTHGSGERIAGGASRPEIVVSLFRRNGVPTHTIGVQLKRPLVRFRQTHFTFQEIEDIKLVSDAPPTPFVNRQGQRDTLEERINPVVHYLQFRDFSRFRTRGERVRGLSDEEWDTCQRLLTPESNNLWEAEGKLFGGDRLRHGFLAVAGNTIAETTLYEVSNVSLDGKESPEQQARLLAQVLRGKVRNIKVYRGMDAIKRLLTVPIEERSF